MKARAVNWTYKEIRSKSWEQFALYLPNDELLPLEELDTWYEFLETLWDKFWKLTGVLWMGIGVKKRTINFLIETSIYFTI